MGAARSPGTGPDSLQCRPLGCPCAPRGRPFFCSIQRLEVTVSERCWPLFPPISGVHFWLPDVLNFITCLPQRPSSSFPTVSAHSSLHLGSVISDPLSPGTKRWQVQHPITYLHLAPLHEWLLAALDLNCADSRWKLICALWLHLEAKELPNRRWEETT